MVLSIRPQTCGLLPPLATVNTKVLNVGVQIPLSDSAVTSFEYIPISRIAGSEGEIETETKMERETE